MRKLAIFVCLPISVALLTSATWAAEGDCNDREVGAVICPPSRTSGSNSVTFTPTPAVSGGGSSARSGTSPGSSIKYVPYNRLSVGPDGEPCATTGYVQEGATPPDERLLVDPNPRETNIPITGSDFRILESYPPCPQQPRAPGESAPIETRAMIAARIWERMPLMQPKPFIAPGRAITGKLAYLETRSQVTQTYSTDTIFGPLNIFATGAYTVSWGDGETSGPHAFEGKPWPNGQITHDYLNVGSYNVVVTERWTASWSLDGESGILRRLQTTGTISNFPVEQIQAVIGR